MKRILTILVLLVLASSMVLAQAEPKTKMAKADESAAAEETVPETTSETEEAIAPTQEKTLPKGLSVALDNVKNENARARIQRNLERFQEKLAARLEKLEDVEVEETDEETGAVTLKAKEPVKYFGFIKGKATKRFDVDANGNVNERAPWYSLFYTEA